MKKFTPISLVAMLCIVLASCSKKESEDNKPESSVTENSAGQQQAEVQDDKPADGSAGNIPQEAKPNVPSSFAPNPDQIRKVIRYNEGGGVEDSILYSYDSQNRLIKLEFGAIFKGEFKNKIEYSYSINPLRGPIIAERKFYLNTLGLYEPDGFYPLIEYQLDPFGKANYVWLLNNNGAKSGHSLFYNNQNFISSTRTHSYKYGDYFVNLAYQVQNNNISQIEAETEALGANYKINFEYYNQPYNHDLFISVYEKHWPSFWNYSLDNLLDVRYNFLGKRNNNLIKRVLNPRLSSPSATTALNYTYEFNAQGLVSAVDITPSSSNGVISGPVKRYEVFYF